MLRRRMIQYATKLGGFSSQYGDPDSLGYEMENILNEPAIYPEYGDSPLALRTYAHWWKIAPEAQQPLPNLSDKFFTSDDYIELMFDLKVYIREVRIYETYNPGAVVRILALDQTAAEHSLKWFVMWEVAGGNPLKSERTSRIFSPIIKSPPFPSQIIRLELRYLRSDNLDYYTELDAVELLGDTDIDVDKLVTPHLDALCLDSNDSETDSVVNADNGVFELLPDEIFFTILSYLSTDELSRLALVSQLFHKHCYDPLLPIHQHLNLQPYWYKIEQNAIDGFAKKCTNIKSLNLSWCGNHSEMLNSPSLIRLIEPITLRRLDLSCCPLTNKKFQEMIFHGQYIEELDISSTFGNLSCRSLQTICALKKLTRLNVYMTYIDDSCMIAIARICTNLQYVNIGSCPAITDLNKVVAAIAENCIQIKGLDLWRGVSLCSEGILHLAKWSKQLTSLDIGFCWPNTFQYTGYLVKLAEGCHGLRKLYLSETHCITDNELVALSKHCSELEQLDIRGNNSVTMSGIHLLMEICRKMTFLDVSFCSGIDAENHKELVKLYPRCSIKRCTTTTI